MDKQPTSSSPDLFFAAKVLALIIVAVLGMGLIVVGLQFLSNRIKPAPQIVQYDVHIAGVGVRISQDDPGHVLSVEQCARAIARLTGLDENQIRCEARQSGGGSSLKKQ